MNKKIVIPTFIVIFFLLFLYVITYSSSGWLKNAQEEVPIYEKDFPYLHSQERITDLLSKVEYAAIVYPVESKTYPNSIFHKYILGNPKEGTSYSVKASVKYTVIGKPVDSIIYGSAGEFVGNNALFIGLCKSEKGFYAPDNGYEFPATQEAIGFVKNITRSDIQVSTETACPEL